MSLSSRVVDIGHYNSIFRVVILSVSSIHKYNFIVILTFTHIYIFKRSIEGEVIIIVDFF